MSVQARDRIKHILLETEYLMELSQRLNSKEELEENKDLKRAAERSIEIIGEAIKTLPDRIRQLSPNTPWNDIARMRDNVIHRYHNVNYEFVWEVIQTNAPELHKELTRIFKILNQEEYSEYKEILGNYPTNSSNFFIRIKQQENLDIAIAKRILAEYPTNFCKVAIAKIRDIIGAGERISEINLNKQKINSNDYINTIIQKATHTK